MKTFDVRPQVSTILHYCADYLLTPDERTLFDWLVVKQCDFGITKPFRASIPQVQARTGVTRRKQDAALKKFIGMGFLFVEIDYYQGNPYRSYFVSFEHLVRSETLSQIIRAGSNTYNDYMEWITEAMQAQKQRQMPESASARKKKEKEAQRAREDVQRLFDRLCDKWRERIEMYNDGELTVSLPQRRKIYSQMPCSTQTKKLMWRALQAYDINTIVHAFVAFADKVLRGEIKAHNMLSYFFKVEDGDWKVIDENIAYHTENYGLNNY